MHASINLLWVGCGPFWCGDNASHNVRHKKKCHIQVTGDIMLWEAERMEMGGKAPSPYRQV